MPLPSSGELLMSAIKAEVGGSNHSLNDLSVLAGKTAPHAMSEFYGYSGQFSPPTFGDGSDSSFCAEGGPTYRGTLSWQQSSDTGVTDHDVQIYNHPADTLRTQGSGIPRTTPYMQWTFQCAPGDYYYRVRYKNSSGKVSPWFYSNVFTISTLNCP